MKFSTWNYSRPDYAEVKKKIIHYKDKMQNATSYQVFRDAWLDVKKEIEYMEFQGEIIYTPSVRNRLSIQSGGG